MLGYKELSLVFDMDNPLTTEYFELVDKHSSEPKYTEEHHILPRSMFPEFAKARWNFVRLTYQQHYRAHEILPFICLQDKHKHSMVSAWVILCGTRAGIRVDASQYANLKKMHSDLMSERTRGEKNYFYGKRWSGEQNHFFGRKHTDEHKEYIRQLKLSPDNPIRGVPQSKDLVDRRMASKRASRIPDGYQYAQYDVEGKLIKLWTDLEIADDRTLYKNDVRRACSGFLQHHRGYKWYRNNIGYEYVCSHEEWLEHMNSEYDKDRWEALYGEDGLGLDPLAGLIKD